MRALYNYDPTDDTLLPTCPNQKPEDIGLEFKKGEILQVRLYTYLYIYV